MKKLTLGLAIILSGVAANSYAALPTGGIKYSVYVPKFCGGFTFGITGLYWRPSASELDYTLTYPDTDLFNLVDGRYHSVDPDYDWGFRANIGYVFPCSGNDITLSWTHYDHNDTDRVRNPGLLLPSLTGDFNPASPFVTAGIFPPFALATIGIPDITVTGIVDTTPVIGTLVTPFFAIPLTTAELDVAAKADLKNDAVDLDFAQSINVACNLRLRWYGGLRYARVDTKLNATYDAVDVTATTFLTGTVRVVDTVGAAAGGTVHITVGFDLLANIREIVNQKSDFEGIGPRLGVDASYALGGGFGIVGGISTSLLIGEIDSSLFERLEETTTATVTSVAATSTSESPVTDIALTADGVAIVPGATFISDEPDAELSFRHPDETRVVPNIDAKIGIDYSYAFCNASRTKLTIEAGWMVSHYFNAIDRVSQVGAVGPEFRTRHTIDASFDGPYIGIQVNI